MIKQFVAAVTVFGLTSGKLETRSALTCNGMRQRYFFKGEGSPAVNRLVRNYRSRRAVVRRNRAIERAIAVSGSSTMRDELLTIANREF